MRRLPVLLLAALLLVAASWAGGWALADPGVDRSSRVAAPDRPAPARAAADVAPPRGPTPHRATTAGVVLERELVPGPTLLGPGAEGDEVRDLQARLRQIAWLDAVPDGVYGEATTAAVSGFQAKREIPVTGAVDQRTLDRLLAMTTEPTEAELTGEPEEDDASGVPVGTLDPRCLTGRVMCVDKSTSTLRWVVDGQVLRTMEARFGGPGFETREGAFSVFSMSRDHVSSIYETSMPYAMFFSGGQAVHYSPDFASVGYAGASHGCVNIRDYSGVAALFDEVAIGDDVVVYWS